MSKKSIKQKKKQKQSKNDKLLKNTISAAQQEVIDNPLPDFVLFIGDENNEILNGDIPVQWCITDSLIEVLNKTNVIDPHVLLIAAKENEYSTDITEMSRQLIPLTQLKTYVRCTSSGDVSIHAWIVNGLEGRSHIFKKYMSMSDGYRSTTMIGLGGGYTSEREIAHYTVEDITVPSGVFGKESGPKMKWFANLWHSSKTVDECNFRQRMILAFTLKWEAMILYTIFILLFRLVSVTSFILCGYRRIIINWKGLLRVFYWDMNDLTSSNYDPPWCNDYIIRKTLGEHKSNYYFITFVPFTPIIVLIFGFLTYISIDHTIFTDVIIVTSQVLAIVVGICFIIDVVQISMLSPILQWFSRINTEHNNIGSKGSYIAGTIILTTCITHIVLDNLVLFMWVSIIAVSTLCLFILLIGLIHIWFKYFTIDEKHNDINIVREVKCNDCDSIEFKPMMKPDLSSKRRPIKLLYLDTKNKICKPMQR